MHDKIKGHAYMHIYKSWKEEEEESDSVIVYDNKW